MPTGDSTGGNPDHYWEIAPTTVSFEPEPGVIRYDVVRGDVANLQDVGGGMIDLGAVGVPSAGHAAETGRTDARIRQWAGRRAPPSRGGGVNE